MIVSNAFYVLLYILFTMGNVQMYLIEVLSALVSSMLPTTMLYVIQNPEEIIENERNIKYKLIELQNMAIYWDTDVTLVGDLPSRDLEVM